VINGDLQRGEQIKNIKGKGYGRDRVPRHGGHREKILDLRNSLMPFPQTDVPVQGIMLPKQNCCPKLCYLGYRNGSSQNLSEVLNHCPVYAEEIQCEGHAVAWWLRHRKVAGSIPDEVNF
jgi:hypothetical protein